VSGRPLSLILLPTLDCNVACDYCFEEKARLSLSREQLGEVTNAILDHMATRGTTRAELYWQGGEVLLLGPAWFEHARASMARAAAERGLSLHHSIQTNLIGYGPHWDKVLREMFDGSLGTSMDFPNHHRRLKNGSTARYTEVWLRSVRQAREAGFAVGVIAVLHGGSLEVSARDFLSFYTQEAGIDDLQVNLPFPGGPGTGGDTLRTEPLTRFLLDLLDVWMQEGFDRGVKLSPFDALFDAFSGREARLPCIWQPNCANEFAAIDARGNVALCDCWVTSYPEHRFGNLFRAQNLSQMLGASPARQAFLNRPKYLVQHEDCARCPHLSLCHGGCPVRTFAATGTILAKDPYCEVYKVLFARCRELAAEAVRRRSPRATRTRRHYDRDHQH
jgi:radical SAM protein with 4Fe4S-binding SPASM domain